jgi:hypothetical protein
MMPLVVQVEHVRTIRSVELLGAYAIVPRDSLWRNCHALVSPPVAEPLEVSDEMMVDSPLKLAMQSLQILCEMRRAEKAANEDHDENTPYRFVAITGFGHDASIHPRVSPFFGDALARWRSQGADDIGFFVIWRCRHEKLIGESYVLNGRAEGSRVERQPSVYVSAYVA